MWNGSRYDFWSRQRFACVILNSVTVLAQRQILIGGGKPMPGPLHRKCGPQSLLHKSDLIATVLFRASYDHLGPMARLLKV